MIARIRLFGPFLLSMLAGVVGAADWSGWRGTDRSGAVADFFEPNRWPDELRQEWKLEVGVGHSSPLVVEEKIYQFSRLGDEETLHCLDISGKLLWKKSYAAPYRMHVAAQGHGKGPKSTPLVSDGKVYTFGISGILSCWASANGELIWQREFSKEYKRTSPLYGAAASPLLSSGQLVVHVGGHDSGAFSAFDASTGEPKWSWNKDGPGYSSPILAEPGGVRQLITQSQSQVIGVSPDGKLLWSVPYKTDYDQNSVSPVVAGDLVIVSGIQRGVTAYRISRRGEGVIATEAWHTDDASFYMSTPVLSGKQLFGFSHLKSGQLVCIDPPTGKVRWTGPGRQGENAALVAAGKVLVALTTEPKLVFVKAGATKYEELARYPASSSPVWAHPVILGQRILIKDESSLSMRTLEAK